MSHQYMGDELVSQTQIGAKKGKRKMSICQAFFVFVKEANVGGISYAFFIQTKMTLCVTEVLKSLPRGGRFLLPILAKECFLEEQAEASIETFTKERKSLILTPQPHPPVNMRQERTDSR